MTAAYGHKARRHGGWLIEVWWVKPWSGRLDGSRRTRPAGAGPDTVTDIKVTVWPDR